MIEYTRDVYTSLNILVYKFSRDKPLRLNSRVIALWFCKQNIWNTAQLSLFSRYLAMFLSQNGNNFVTDTVALLWKRIFFFSEVDCYCLIEPSHLLHRSIHGKIARKLINIGFGKLSKEHFLTEAYFSCGEKYDLSSNYIGKSHAFFLGLISCIRLVISRNTCFSACWWMAMLILQRGYVLPQLP